MLNSLLIIFGKSLSRLTKLFNLGNGSTWPGHIALLINPRFITDLLHSSHLKTILIAGTNGKTTTSAMVRTVLEANGSKVIQNDSGANLLNGIASSLLLQTNALGHLNQDYAIFEVDENILPLILKEFTPDFIILNNLFRDQLDRYGEVDTIARKWKAALNNTKTTLILNADDPQIAYLGKGLPGKIVYFGIAQAHTKTVDRQLTKMEHASDSLYCPNCGSKLIYKTVTFSHLGDWSCTACRLRRPKLDLSDFVYFPLLGTYNTYNTLAAVLLLSEIGLSEKQIMNGLKHFTAAFGRQESITFAGKRVQLFLSKNPTGFNESLRTVVQLGAKVVLLVLNDRVADGKDVSWIWDVDFEEFVDTFEHVFVSGERAYDLGLRLKYAGKDHGSKTKDQNHNSKVTIIQDLGMSIQAGIDNLGEKETLFVLPTYTAMLDIRKILTGRKIL